MDNLLNADGDLIGVKLPSALSDIFYIDFYSKYNSCFDYLISPECFWKNMSYKYNNVNLMAPEQVHMTNIVKLSDASFLPERPECDGVFIKSSDKDAACLRFADCTPVILAGLKPEPWILMIHSGFNGTLLNITGESVNKLINTGDIITDKDNVWAWVGPSICKNCYNRKQSDPKTITAVKTFDNKNFTANKEYINFNIKGEIRTQLLNIGVSSENIMVSTECTNCSCDKYLSYRAGDKIHRMFIIAGVKNNKSLS